MEWFPAQHQMTIKEELTILGFSEPEKIIAKAEMADDPLDPCAKAVICDEIKVGDHFTASIFFLIRERIGEVWYIDGIMTGVQMETTRNEEGVLLIQRAYSVGIEPFPSVGQIKTDIDDLVRYEEYVEFFLVNNELEGEFRNLGFNNSGEILKTARHMESLTFLVANEPIFSKDSALPEAIKFQFIVLSDITKGMISITFIKAYLASNGPSAAKIKEDTETLFFALNGQLPAKNQMIYEILGYAGEDDARYEAIRRKFQPGDNLLNVRRQSYHQGRLHL